jgi:hypothetical protein
MEIILPSFNIDDAIKSQWQATAAKTEIITSDRQKAEETAVKLLVDQFQKELDTFVDGNIQKSLNFKIVPPKEINVLSVVGIFNYLDNEFLLKRDSQNWEISFGGRSVLSPPDLLQKTLLLELGRIKNEKLS